MISWLKLILIKIFDRVALFFFILGLLNVEISPSGKPSSRAFSNLLNIFPLRVLGMLSTNSISFRRRQDPFLFWQIPECPSSFRQWLLFRFKTTNAFTNSPIVGSGFPITAASAPPDASLKYFPLQGSHHVS
jgi:hypothetical protein